MDSLISAHRPTPCCFHHSPSPPDSRSTTRNEAAMRPVHHPPSLRLPPCQRPHIRALDIEIEMRQKRQQVARKSAHSGHFGHATCWTASAVSASKARSNVKCGKNGKPSQRQRIRPPACAACTNPNSGHFGQHPRPVSICAPRRNTLRRRKTATIGHSSGASQRRHRSVFPVGPPTINVMHTRNPATIGQSHLHPYTRHPRPRGDAAQSAMSTGPLRCHGARMAGDIPRDADRTCASPATTSSLVAGA